jgi:hypothetical protein
LRKLKAKEPIKYEQIRQDLWKKTLGGFCQETIWKHKVCGGIFVDTHKIAISNHRIRSIDTQM